MARTACEREEHDDCRLCGSWLRSDLFSYDIRHSGAGLQSGPSEATRANLSAVHGREAMCRAESLGYSSA